MATWLIWLWRRGSNGVMTGTRSLPVLVVAEK